MQTTWLIIWLVILIILVIVELITTNMTTIFFAAGALISAIMAILGVPVWIEIVVFVVVSFLLFAFVRPVAKRNFDRSHKRSSREELVGMRGLVISQIDNLRGIGLVRVSNQEWSAHSQERNVIIPEGAIVEVIGIRGEKLIVRLDESMETNMELRTSDALLDPRYFE